MTEMMKAVDRRTGLVGQNRLELLLFRLWGRQLYGINVFKVREVLPCPPLTLLPHRQLVVRGVAHVRGAAVPVIDLSQAIGDRPLPESGEQFAIITEYSGAIQAFLVSGVDRIVNLRWEEVSPPPPGAGSGYLTAVTRVAGELVEIIDVEQVLAELMPVPTSVSPRLTQQRRQLTEESAEVLIVDDSMIARRQIQRCVESLGVRTTLLSDGRQALEHLQELADQGVAVERHYLMMISDIEMPEMDGYTLTAAVRQDPRLASLHVLLHTSLSGVFNRAMIEKVGADGFLAKFNPDALGEQVLARLSDADVA